jgi:hypothetical protein
MTPHNVTGSHNGDPIKSVRSFFTIERDPSLDAVEMTWSEEKAMDAAVDMTDCDTDTDDATDLTEQ